MRFWTRSLLAAAVVVVGSGWAIAAWGLNPQPLPPRVLGVVRDACTGLPVAGATVNLTTVPGTAGGVNPGSTQTGAFGGFSLSGTPGVYDMSVVAAGYTPLGDAALGGDFGVGIEVDLDLLTVPLGEAANETVIANVLLAPSTPGVACAANPGPIGLPVLTVLVRNGTTGLPIAGASGTLTPATGQRDPGLANFGLLGLFGWNTLSAGDYTLTIAAPRYTNPGPIQVTKDPGPIQFPDGSSVSIGKTLDIQLGQPPAFSLPQSPYLLPYAFKAGSSNIRFTVYTTGSPIPTISLSSVTLAGNPVLQGVTFTDNGDGSATIGLSKQLGYGTYRIDLNASNTFGSATQTVLMVIKP